MPHGIIELDNGRRYECIFSIAKGEKAARENGLPLWPDEPTYIDDLECTTRTPKGRVKVTSERIVNRCYDKLSKEL